MYNLNDVTVINNNITIFTNGYEVNNIQDERMIYKKRKKEKMVTELLFMLAFIVLIFILVFFIKSTETSYYVVPAMLLIRIATDAGGRAGNKKR